MESLNQRAFAVCRQAIDSAAALRIEVLVCNNRETIVDFGVSAPGSDDAGLILAKICLSDLGQVERTRLNHDGRSLPAIRVKTTDPLQACMASQYAGWQISAGKYFAMCSGPIRAVYGKEKLFEKYSISKVATTVVGVLEASSPPDETVFQWLRERLPISVRNIVLCVARTSSIAGRIQIVARSIETACHKLFELGFDLKRIRSGEGIAPIPLAASSDLEAMGNTNDAILYASQVKLIVDIDDAKIEALGPQIPSCSSPQFGRPFAELLSEFGGDFYKIDPLLFAPAEITLQSSRNGFTQTFGALRTDLYVRGVKGEA